MPGRSNKPSPTHWGLVPPWGTCPASTGQLVLSNAYTALFSFAPKPNQIKASLRLEQSQPLQIIPCVPICLITHLLLFFIFLWLSQQSCLRGAQNWLIICSSLTQKAVPGCWESFVQPWLGWEHICNCCVSLRLCGTHVTNSEGCHSNILFIQNCSAEKTLKFSCNWQEHKFSAFSDSST